MRIGVSGIGVASRVVSDQSWHSGSSRPRPNVGAPARTPQPIRLSSDARAGVSAEPERMAKRDSPALEKVHELEHTADVGESDKTPLILLGETWVVASSVVLAILLVSLLAYWLAS